MSGHSEVMSSNVHYWSCAPFAQSDSLLLWLDKREEWIDTSKQRERDRAKRSESNTLLSDAFNNMLVTVAL